jgi:hypothetical protein
LIVIGAMTLVDPVANNNDLAELLIANDDELAQEKEVC